MNEAGRGLAYLLERWYIRLRSLPLAERSVALDVRPCQVHRVCFAQGR